MYEDRIGGKDKDKGGLLIVNRSWRFHYVFFIAIDIQL
jgi:hypothetical protein